MLTVKSKRLKNPLKYHSSEITYLVYALVQKFLNGIILQIFFCNLLSLLHIF